APTTTPTTAALALQELWFSRVTAQPTTASVASPTAASSGCFMLSPSRRPKRPTTTGRRLAAARLAHHQQVRKLSAPCYSLRHTTRATSRALLDRHPLSQVPRLVDVGAPADRPRVP